MDRAIIKQILLANGFKEKEQPDGSIDLNPYVYDAIEKVLESNATLNLSGEQQYLKALSDIYHNGEEIYNDRTGKVCKTIIGIHMRYNVGAGQVPMTTTREYDIRPGVAELLGYIRGYTSAADFRKLGTKTWDANANLNADWLKNPARKGTDDMGMVYGAVAKNWPTHSGETIDLIHKVYNNLRNGTDDRGETITFWNPGVFNIGCLRPCLKEHTFSLVNGKLSLTSIQRSNDWVLGCNANMIQVYVFLALMAQITGNQAHIADHYSINAHLYEDQLPFVPEQLSREPKGPCRLWINPEIKTLKDVETWVTVDDFKILDYSCHAKIKYPFSV